MIEAKVLDHGHIRLVDHMGNDLSVVRAARVSYAAEWRSGNDDGADARLIRYLLKNKHTSPFEHVSFTFEVKAPIFVFRQWHRHRTWSFNEVSARYTELDMGFYVPPPEHIGVQSKDNKQVRDMFAGDLDEARLSSQQIRVACETAFTAYRSLLIAGCPREIARGVLPVNAYSRMFATIDLHNLLQFLRLRDHSHAQYEIRVYAQAMRSMIEQYVPATLAAFDELENNHG